MLTTKEAVLNLRKAIAHETLIQGEWSDEDSGRHLGCALHQMGGKEVDILHPFDCPASVMPQWLAIWLVGAFDGVDPSVKYEAAEDFAATLEAAIGWTSERWELLRVEFLCGLIDMAVEAAEPVSQRLPCWTEVKMTCRQVQDALRGHGDLNEAGPAAKAAARLALVEAKASEWMSLNAAGEAARTAVASTVSAVEAARKAVNAAREAAGAERLASWAAAKAAARKTRREQFSMLRRLAEENQ